MWITGWGEAQCAGQTRLGCRCRNHELAGIGYCLHHAPDELLAEAEALAGFRRCRRCGQYAVKGSPDLCRRHGMNQGSAQRRRADLNATAMEIIEEALGAPRKHRRKRLVPVKATWRGVA